MYIRTILLKLIITALNEGYLIYKKGSNLKRLIRIILEQISIYEYTYSYI